MKINFRNCANYLEVIPRKLGYFKVILIGGNGERLIKTAAKQDEGHVKSFMQKVVYKEKSLVKALNITLQVQQRTQSTFGSVKPMRLPCGPNYTFYVSMQERACVQPRPLRKTHPRKGSSQLRQLP